MNESKRDTYKKYNKQILVAILITLIPFAYMTGYQIGSNDVHEGEEIEYGSTVGIMLGILLSEIVIFIYLSNKYDDFNEPFETLEWITENDTVDTEILELIAERNEKKALS